ncbi:hypothetical protein Tco_0154703 [Tanacetum coccineum]
MWYICDPTPSSWCKTDALSINFGKGRACIYFNFPFAIKLATGLNVFQQDPSPHVPHHGIDLWLQVQIFYDPVNPATRRTIDQSAGGKLHNINAEESWALIEDLALNDNKSWNDPRDLAKLVKAISLPQDVPSTFDRRLVKLKNQVQCLMEAHLAPKQSIQVNKITSSCEIYSGPHDTQYFMENPEQAFVDYASLHTNEAGGKWFTLKPEQNNLGDTYNLSWKSHPNLRVRVLLVWELREMLQAMGEIMQQVKQGLLSVTIVKAEESSQVLDEEQLAFLADPGIAEGQYFEQSPIDNYLDTEITSDSNIISYEQYLQETQNTVVQDTNSSVEQDVLIIYKERVKLLEERQNVDLNSREKYIDSQMNDMILHKNSKFASFEDQIDTLKQNISKYAKENECLMTSIQVSEKQTQEKEDKYIEKEIDLEKEKKELENIMFKVGQSAQMMHMLTKPQLFYAHTHKQALGYQNLFYLKKAQRIKPTLYDGIVISKKHDVVSVDDYEEKLILAKES